MTNKLEAATRQALEAFEYALGNTSKTAVYQNAITALREALDPELQFVRDWNEGKVRRVSDGKIMGVAEQAEQEPVYKALRVAEEALVYHTEQTRPIQKTDETIIYLRNVMAQGLLNMAFTLEDAMDKYPEISYWHSEFIKHNTTTEQAEQEPVAWIGKGGFNTCGEGQPLYAAPVRTKDLTDDEIISALDADMDTDEDKARFLEIARAVIAAYKEKNK